ncbi:MAG: aspartyl-tRNA(Asn)/glutamyl-tRNA(Gln) amidotransferase subunit B [Cyclobacteriaceae bacterium]|jgi:aspartyl-tRNA(Asn)/glutamyl-tRNA(Gln) amidotransferase subunit B
MKVSTTYEVVIGLEVHVQLSTIAKIFAPEKNDFGSSPNSDVSAVTIAHPGTLPVLNRQVIEYGVKLGIALSSEISRSMVFDRKNYFYPDLPKGYQITQDRTPICVGGHLELTLSDGTIYDVSLTKAHLEEDAGKSIHTEHSSKSFVDLNRSGVPLLEIVTDPVMHTAEQAMIFLKEIRTLIRYLNISDGNMEEGSMRCDANISLRKPGQPLGSKVEIKNMNSIRNVGRAIEHEIVRQNKLLDEQVEIESETRTFDADTGDTHEMRSKESLNDYRYFPDPDLSPVFIDDKWFEEIEASMPKLPSEIKRELVEEYKLSTYDSVFLAEDPALYGYWKACMGYTKLSKQVTNWLMGSVQTYLNNKNMEIVDFPLHPSQLTTMVHAIEQNQVSRTAAINQLFPYLMLNTTSDISEAIDLLKIRQEDNEAELMQVIESVLANFPDKIKAYHQGKKGLIGMFMGQVMKEVGNNADPKKTNQLLEKALQNKKETYV